MKKIDVGMDAVYELVDRKVGVVEEKVDIINSRLSNIEGRLMMVPILISGGMGVFFFIVGLVTKK